MKELLINVKISEIFWKKKEKEKNKENLEKAKKDYLEKEMEFEKKINIKIEEAKKDAEVIF